MITATSPVAFSFFKSLLSGRGSLRFMVAIVFSFAFSISVILCTVGLMDGFEYTLKRALKLSSGDISLYSKRGFFVVDQEMQQVFEDLKVAYAPFIQTEGFLVGEGISKGVMVRGVESDSFSAVSGQGISLMENELAIGKELAQVAGLKVGDEVALALATGKKQLSTLPGLYGFRIKQVVDHKIYEKNMRLAYMDLSYLQSLLGVRDRINLVALNKFSVKEPQLIDKVEALQKDLTQELDPLMVIRPFWQEFAHLLEAVEVEKLVMTLVLQLVVVIAIFNVVAFVIFLGQQKAKDIFVFCALGISRKNVVGGWLMLLALIWFLSCLLATGFSAIFGWAMAHMSFLELPGEIYNLERVEVKLSIQSYLLAFLLAFLWLMAISWPGLKRLQKKSLLSQLRLEFN